jgi:hypothetical protein
MTTYEHVLKLVLWWIEKERDAGKDFFQLTCYSSNFEYNCGYLGPPCEHPPSRDLMNMSHVPRFFHSRLFPVYKQDFLYWLNWCKSGKLQAFEKCVEFGNYQGYYDLSNEIALTHNYLWWAMEYLHLDPTDPRIRMPFWQIVPTCICIHTVNEVIHEYETDHPDTCVWFNKKTREYCFDTEDVSDEYELDDVEELACSFTTSSCGRGC